MASAPKSQNRKSFSRFALILMVAVVADALFLIYAQKPLPWTAFAAASVPVLVALFCHWPNEQKEAEGIIIMLRVGLTGDLGSGKSTVAQMFAAHGAIILSSDEMARAMMQPGEAVFADLVAHFGPAILDESGQLNRGKLAQLAFTEGRAEELNAIIHPAVIAEQARQLEALATTEPDAIVVIESALIFLTRHAPGGQPWQQRFDCIVLVTAPEAQKIQRFIDRIVAGRTLSPEEQAAFEADAHRRLALQTANATHAAECLVLHNDGNLAALEQQVNAAWDELKTLKSSSVHS